MWNPLDVFGLPPLPIAIRQALIVFRGMTGVPSSRFGLSSIGIFHPRVAVATWLGQNLGGDCTVVLNLFNHVQSPIAEGWSVRRTRIRDFRGRGLTYDSHNGTDFAVPPGHPIVASASGRVVRISSEFHRGGIKVVIDHSGGLITTSNHLMRATVAVSERVIRGQTIGISGASGIDALAAFPWNCPHVHFNTWLDGEPVDPFAARLDVPLWRNGNFPGPAVSEDEPVVESTPWNMVGIEKLIADCIHPKFRAELGAISDPELRAANTVFYRNYYPTLFDQSIPLVTQRTKRTARLDLPFKDFRGVVFADEL